MKTYFIVVVVTLAISALSSLTVLVFSDFPLLIKRKRWYYAVGIIINCILAYWISTFWGQIP